MARVCPWPSVNSPKHELGNAALLLIWSWIDLTNHCSTTMKGQITTYIQGFAKSHTFDEALVQNTWRIHLTLDHVIMFGLCRSSGPPCRTAKSHHSSAFSSYLTTFTLAPSTHDHAVKGCTFFARELTWWLHSCSWHICFWMSRLTTMTSTVCHQIIVWFSFSPANGWYRNLFVI